MTEISYYSGWFCIRCGGHNDHTITYCWHCDSERED